MKIYLKSQPSINQLYLWMERSTEGEDDIARTKHTEQPGQGFKAAKALTVVAFCSFIKKKLSEILVKYLQLTVPLV